jgi:hypothetical protein
VASLPDMVWNKKTQKQVKKLIEENRELLERLAKK